MYKPILGLICLALAGTVQAIESRYGQGCAYIKHSREIYCFGGEPFSSASNDMPVFSLDITDKGTMDLKTLEWKTIPKASGDVAPQAASKFMFSPTGDDDSIYIEGGKVCPGCPPNYGYTYSTSKKLWKQMNNYKPIVTTPAVYANGAIWSFGGVTDSQIGLPQKITTLYNIAVKINTTTWNQGYYTSETSTYPQATWDSSMVYSPLDNLLIVIGGYEYLEKSVLVKMDDIIAIDIGEKKYSKLTGTTSLSGSLPESRHGHTAIMDPTNKFVVMFGGCDSNMVGMNDIWLYNIESRTWEKKNTYGTPPSKRCRHSVVVVENYMIVLFGEYLGYATDDIAMALDLNTWTWTSQPVFGSQTNKVEKRGVEEATTTVESSGLSTKATTGVIVSVIFVIIANLL
ncbi:hypothetical protein J3Q64DRAFT_1750940 [Phycomyces blakesleeanus]|uniref:Galactose oxidase n=1 Tax=Phycomyces blakesleeanus TaxID=4837 RepID=A0ABR3AYT0_PHYBL